VLVRGLPPTMATVILMDSSDLLWATIAEQANVTRSRSPGVPGYSVSPIPISNIKARLLELQQPIMQNVSMMSGQSLLNIMILQVARRQVARRHQQHNRPRQRHPRAPTNTVHVVQNGRSFTARVDGKTGWRRIARSHALQDQLVQSLRQRGFLRKPESLAHRHAKAPGSLARTYTCTRLHQPQMFRVLQEKRAKTARIQSAGPTSLAHPFAPVASVVTQGRVRGGALSATMDNVLAQRNPAATILDFALAPKALVLDETEQ